MTSSSTKDIQTKQTTILKGFVAGSLAACSAVTFTNPWDFVKTQLQLSGELQSRLALSASHEPTMRQIFMRVYSKFGILGVQRGLAAAYFYQLSMNGTRFTIYDPLKNYLHKQIGPFPNLLNFAAGGMSGATAALVGSPFNLVKTRIQSMQYDYRSVFDAFYSIIKCDGVFGLYRGVSSSMVRTAMGSSVQLSSYDFIKTCLTRSLGMEDAFFVHLLTSMAAGLATCVVMTPPDVINTRMYNQQQIEGALKYRGMLDCLIKTVRIEGFRALYKGFWPLYVRIGPHTILTFVFLEQYRNLLNKVSL